MSFCVRIAMQSKDEDDYALSVNLSLSGVVRSVPASEQMDLYRDMPIMQTKT